MYEKEEKLDLEKQVGLTKEIYEILRKEKRKQKISMAKIVCNLILKEYGPKPIQNPGKIKNNK